MMKKVKKGSAIIALLALVLSTVVIPKAYAALAVDTGRENCSIELNVAKNVTTGDVAFEELEKLPVKVNLYKMATIDVAGRYKAVKEAYESLKLEEVNSETEAAEWEAKGLAAKELVKDTEADATVTLVNGTGTATGLKTGMYLVVPQEIESADYAYTFKPYLISLPNNYYTEENQDDTWVYNLVGANAIGLKPAYEDRYGDLVIEKDLKSFNATVGGATFVFQVEAVKDYSAVGGEEDVKVYSDVVALTFDAAGKQSLTIEKIPAGAVVTVTEIYSGGSYKVTGSGEFETVILANEAYDQVVEETAEEVETATVTFVNDYDGSLNGGTGVVNHFEAKVIDEDLGTIVWDWANGPEPDVAE